MTRLIWMTAIAAAACGGEPSSPVVMSTSFVVTDQTGMGASPLDVLVGQTVAFEIEFDHAGVFHETVDTCTWTTLSATMPPATASGATAGTVTTEILERLPGWDLRLALCDVPNQSSIGLLADNQAGLGVTLGCLVVPASAMVRDGDGNPEWTSFTATSCDATLYDQLHSRLFTSRDFAMTFTR